MGRDPLLNVRDMDFRARQALFHDGDQTHVQTGVATLRLKLPRLSLLQRNLLFDLSDLALRQLQLSVPEIHVFHFLNIHASESGGRRQISRPRG